MAFLDYILDMHCILNRSSQAVVEEGFQKYCLPQHKSYLGCNELTHEYIVKQDTELQTEEQASRLDLSTALI